MFVDRPEGPLYYEVIDADGASSGEPETIVFLHGVAATHAMWRDWVPQLTSHYRLAMIDLRGFGQSNAMDRLATWTLDDLSDDILAVADQIGAAAFHVVGESSGGTAVLNLATRGLARVLTATTLSTAHRGGQIERVKKWRADIEQNGVAWWSRQMMDRRFKPGAITDEDWTWFCSVQDQTMANALLRMGDILRETDLTDNLAGVTCPLLIISPDRSPFVTPDIAVEILTHVPSAELCIIPDSRHGIFFSHGAFCARQLSGFLARHAADHAA